MGNVFRIILFIFLFNLAGLILVNAQQINSLYFIENSPERTNLNPAFDAGYKLYIGIPLLTSLQFETGNNSLTLHDIVYNQNGSTYSFISNQNTVNQFYNQLSGNTIFNTDVKTGILDGGFNNRYGSWNFQLNERGGLLAVLPKDIFNFLFYGTPDIISNNYNFSPLQASLSLYTEFSAGYSRRLNDRLRVGGRLKFLIGSADFSAYSNQLTLNAGLEKWNLNGLGGIYFSGQLVNMDFSYSGLPAISLSNNVLSWFKPSGWGAGMDLGVEFRLNNEFRISAALLDVGFIRWSQNAKALKYSMNYTFDGIGNVNSSMSVDRLQALYNSLINGNQALDSLMKSFQSSVKLSAISGSYTTTLSTKLNLGIEYNIFDQWLRAGCLSTTTILNNALNEEITASINSVPLQNLDVSLSYSLLNGNFSTFGFATGLRAGPVLFSLAADYIPFTKLNVNLSDLNSSLPVTNIPIPYNASKFNFSFSMKLVFGERNNAIDNVSLNESPCFPNQKKFNRNTYKAFGKR